MPVVKRNLRLDGQAVWRFAKFLLIGVLTGIVGGVVGALFHMCVSAANQLRSAHDWLIWLLPAGGMAIALLYTKGGVEGVGTDRILDAVHEGAPVPARLVPMIFAGTVITHLLGGSAGREGAALQLGGGIGYRVGGLLKLDDKDMRLVTLCGMSSVFSALFGTPLTASVFALEVVSVGVMYYAGLVPCLASALTASWVAEIMGVAPTRFAVAALPALSPLNLLRTVGLGAVCAVVSVLFCLSLHGAAHCLARAFKNPLTRGALGGAALVALTCLSGTRDYNGAGTQVIERAIAGQALPAAFLLKILFTALTIGSGFKGGEVVPSFFIGATLGCVAGPVLGLPAGFSAAMGLAAVFCGVVNCPLTSILLSVELFGSEGLLFYAIACAVSYALSGYYSLYHSQRIVYAKLRDEYINAQTK